MVGTLDGRGDLAGKDIVKTNERRKTKSPTDKHVILSDLVGSLLLGAGSRSGDTRKQFNIRLKFTASASVTGTCLYS